MNETIAPLLREQIRELTRQMREDPDWSALHGALKCLRLKPTDVLLISFEEDACTERGAVVIVHDRRAYEFERPTALSAVRFTRWRRLAITPEGLADHPTLSEAIKMLEEGAIE